MCTYVHACPCVLCVHACMCMCVLCVCVCARACMCTCVCVCVSTTGTVWLQIFVVENFRNYTVITKILFTKFSSQLIILDAINAG